LHLDTADTGSADGGDLDVTFVTPSSTPGVSDDVVVKVGGGIVSITDGGNGVIEVGSASGGVENTGLILLEDSLVSLNGD
jgi:hypothetical protein